ncbi:Putative neutral zinc metallopeptidase [Psychrobacter sp. LV10R520-6]|nr:Putative neutral zinc metallopeptidase [Psychrobacter sp. LV10R520-6]
MFNGQVSSACGSATAATGPFYCPGDQTVYLDTSFFAEMRQNLGITGDVDEAINAAGQIGDDRLARASGRAVTPDSFTHGTSQQRVNWFTRGLESGSVQSCDTFSGAL